MENGIALFPDAPTSRGARHVEALASAKKEGYGAAAIFLVQRGDALAFAPNDAADSDFGMALREAVKGGVEVYAYKCSVSREGISLDGELEATLAMGGYK